MASRLDHRPSDLRGSGRACQSLKLFFAESLIQTRAELVDIAVLLRSAYAKVRYMAVDKSVARRHRKKSCQLSPVTW